VAAERLVNALPLRGERAEAGARLEERRSDAERALSYVELYGAYSERGSLSHGQDGAAVRKPGCR